MPVGDPAGPTRGQAAGRKWRQTSRGLYVPATVTDDVVEQRIMEQASRLPEGGAITGWAALRLAGGNYFDGLEADGKTRVPVPLAVGQGSGMRSGRGAVVSSEPLPADAVREIAGIPCVRPVRALFDEVRRLGDVREGCVAIDMAAAARLVAIWQLSDFLHEHRSWRRSRIVDGALCLADERSRSPAEPRMRNIWILDAGLPVPRSNRPVFDLEGNHLGTPDLLDVTAGVVGEYDGAVHLKTSKRGKDIAREERFRSAGLEYFTVVGSDLHDIDLVVRRMQRTRERSLQTGRERRWTTTAPPGWEEELTYGEELRFRAWQRQLDGLEPL
ncbi:MAG TPA: hypothetical protein VFK34_02415 [Marmoricola sp.]|nr:hypothetical protein [Marmoricola sp.]